MPADEVRVLIAASGTGGHLFPALFIARAFRELLGERARIEFVGSGRPLEAKLIDGAGFVRHVITTAGVKRRGLKGLLEFASTLPRALLGVRRILKTLKPHVVVGVGGYVSVLPVTLARLYGIKTWIHEAELRPGMANSLLCRYAQRVSIAFEKAVMPRASNLVYTGHPVRPELSQVRPVPDLKASPRRILVIGGSQGAQAIDAAMLGLAEFLRRHEVELRHQTRPENVEAMKSEYASHKLKAEVSGFIDDMAAAYDWCELIVSRSGAGSVMEIGVVNRPAILIPYPYAQGNHQAANARTLESAGKALIVEEGAHFGERLRGALSKLLDPHGYNEIKNRPFESRSPGASHAIARGCLELAGIEP